MELPRLGLAGVLGTCKRVCVSDALRNPVMTAAYIHWGPGQPRYNSCLLTKLTPKGVVFLFCFVLFCSVLFCSVLFCSVLSVLSFPFLSFYSLFLAPSGGELGGGGDCGRGVESSMTHDDRWGQPKLSLTSCLLVLANELIPYATCHLPDFCSGKWTADGNGAHGQPVGAWQVAASTRAKRRSLCDTVKTRTMAETGSNKQINCSLY